MKKITFNLGSAMLIVLLSAGVLASCNNANNNEKKDSTTVKMDTSNKMPTDTSRKMMRQDTGHKSDQTPPPKN
jgi:ABC-type Fe3+-citrate transport system substrate-binding protein